MDRDEALRLLRGGPEGIAEWNRRWLAGEEILDLGGAYLEWAHLEGAHLEGAYLEWAHLEWAHLEWAHLGGAHLEGAHLIGAHLEGAHLEGAHLTGAHLEGVHLEGADLEGADLEGAHLEWADLEGADLEGAHLEWAHLTGADLGGANLTLARLIRCTLEDAIFNEADVTDCHVQETIGRPKPPNLLRVGDRPPLTGDDARSFFNPPATVEVYLTEVLTDEELGAFRFHLGDMRRQGVGTGVHLTGERQEVAGTVLRFQAPTYAEVYDVLPILLKPFRMSRAVDWAKTYEALPEHDRRAALTTLAKIEAEDPERRWLFAHRMAEVSYRYFNAKIMQIREGRNQGVLIKIASSQAVERRLAQQPRRASTGPRFQLTYVDHPMTNEVKAQGNIVGAAIAAGNIVNARDINAFINSVDQSQGLDPELKRVLVEARRALESGTLTGPDKDDAADDLGKITEEIKKPEPQPSRIKRLFDSIKKLAPDVASILSSAAKIGEMIKG